jgi:hypothetical protein
LLTKPNHHDAKAPKDPIPRVIDEVASKIVDVEIQIERPCSVPTGWVERRLTQYVLDPALRDARQGGLAQIPSSCLPTVFEAVKKLDFVFLALVFSVTYRREKPDFFNFFTASFAVG